MTSSNQLKILLVEDSDTDALLLQENIQLSGGDDLKVSRARSLHEAVEYLNNNHIDVTLLDLTLPDSSGLDTIIRLRGARADMPIVVLTGVDDQNTGVEAVRMGVQDYLVKGQVDGRVISRAIRYSIERKRAEDEIRRSSERFEILSETASDLLRNKNPQDVVNKLCLKIMRYLDCDVFFNFLVDEQKKKLRLSTCAGIPEKTAKSIEWLDFGASICGCVAQQGQIIVAENIPETNDPRTYLLRPLGVKAYACHPLMSQDRVIGTLAFGTRSRTTFSDDDLTMMKAVTDQVATAMERMRAEETLRQSYEELNRFNRAAVGRELRIIELKKEVNDFCDLTGQMQRYPLDFEKENDNGKNETRIT